MRREGGGSVGSVWVRGAFSGIATACCAPVLAGVVGLAGSTASFGLALAVGSAYVFGMVAPLAVLALAWDAKDWGGLLSPDRRTVPFRLGRGPASRTLRLPLVNVLTGAVLLAMGAFTLRSAFTGPGMSNTGWQVHLTARLNHMATTVEHQLAVLPGWVQTGAVLMLAAAFAVAARRLSRPDFSDDTEPGQPAPSERLSPDPTASVRPLEQGTDDRKSALR